MSSSDKLNSTSVYCRICHEGLDESLEELIEPCKCSGSLGLVHASCLEKWLSTSNTDRCEICKYVFTIQRINKPITQWWRSSSVHGPRPGMSNDAIWLMILTPLCIASTYYLCASDLGYWESTGLTILCWFFVVIYCIWLGRTLSFHCIIWRQWRRQNQDVILLVKHKIDETENLNEKSLAGIREIRQDRNNNRDMDEYGSIQNRFICEVSFNHEEDPAYRTAPRRYQPRAYTLRYQTTYV